MGKIALELKMQWLRERGLVGAAATTRMWTLASETYNLAYWERNCVGCIRTALLAQTARGFLGSINHRWFWSRDNGKGQLSSQVAYLRL